MKTIKIKQVFTDLKEGIKASDQAYGLEYYAGYVVKSKLDLLKHCKEFYLIDGNKLLYVTWFKRGLSDPLTKYGILHTFDWISCLDTAKAAIVKIDREALTITIGDHIWERDYLRTQNRVIWTTDRF